MNAIELITKVLQENVDNNTNIFQHATDFIIEVDCNSLAKMIVEELVNNNLIENN
jgi:hypothetical protein